MLARRAVAIAVSAVLALTVVGCGPEAPAPVGPGTSASPAAPGPTGARPTTGPGGPDAPEPVASRPTRPDPTASGPAEPGPPPPSPGVDPRPTSPPPVPRPPVPHPPAPAPTPSATQPPAAVVPAAWRGRDVERILTDRRVVALTFDAGASDAGLRSILDTLARERVAATFFVTGAFARAHPDEVAAIAAAGHPVGNHSDTHRSVPDLTDAQIADDLARAEAAISAATGRPAKPLFRFPFGARTPYDIGVVNDLGYVPFRWSVDSLGWRGTSQGGSAAAVADRVVGAAQPGMIALMHVGANPDDGTTFDADALPSIIERLRTAGYGFMDLEGVVR
jgi:peptidoglycan/xylan/chitin deacetylase (PgdA/CDA1 family)